MLTKEQEGQTKQKHGEGRLEVVEGTLQSSVLLKL
jgi:hypothetical protein